MFTHPFGRAILLIGALLCAGLHAQVVRFANHSSAPFNSWKRTQVDQLPPHPAGRVGDVRYVVGKQTGFDTWAVDLRVTLAPRATLEVDLAQSTAEPFEVAPLPADPLAHFGGPLTLAGNAAALVGIEQDGAGYVATLRARCGRLLCLNSAVLWYPGEAIAHGEAALVASNPAVPDWSETAPVDVRLAFGDAFIWVPGAGIGGRLLAAGQTLASGQGVVLPFTMLWMRHARSFWDVSSAVAAALHVADPRVPGDRDNWGISAVGIRKLLPEGNPLMPIGFSGRQWTERHWRATVQSLHRRGETLLGPAPFSGQTGEQETQTFHPGGECMVPDGLGAEVLRWLAAIRAHGLRPCNHLEVDGWPLVIEQHPNLILWDGRPYGSSPDKLGKPPITDSQFLALTGGHSGPDVQHCILGDLAAADRVMWSPMADWLLERQATVYLLQRTTTRGWGTTGFDSAREWGWEALSVLQIHSGLRNRALAERVVTRFRERVLQVFLPAMEGKDLICLKFDNRVNPLGAGAQWWGESWAAMAMHRTCSILGPVQALAPCERIAAKVLATAWHLDPDGRYRAQAQGPLDGSSNADNLPTHGFNHYGMPGCVWLTMKTQPGHPKARAIWVQLMAAPGETARRWMLPL